MALSLGSYNVYVSGRYYSKEIKRVEDDYIKMTKQWLKTKGDTIFSSIVNQKELATLKPESLIKERVETAYKIANHIYRDNLYEDENDVKEKIVSAMRLLCWGEGLNYIFINDIRGNAILQPEFPELENTNLLTGADKEIVKIIRENIKLIIAQGEGVIFTKFKKSDSMTDKLFEQIVYLKDFGHFGWYLGSLYYIDDLIMNLKEDLLMSLILVDYEEEYLSIFELSEDGKNTFAKVLVDTENQNMVGKTVDDEYNEVIGSDHTKTGFDEIKDIGYIFSRYTTTENGMADKILCYRIFYEDWNWIIEIRTSLNDIYKNITNDRAFLKKNLTKQIINGLFILLLFVFISLFISRFFVKLINKIFKNYSSNIESQNDKLETAYRKLKDMYYVDDLTGLQNINSLHVALEELTVTGELFLAVISLNNFKILNNFFGYMAGYHIIKQIGNKVKDLIEDSQFEVYKLENERLALLYKGEEKDDKIIERQVYSFIYMLNKTYIDIPQYETNVATNIRGVVVKGVENLIEKANIVLERAIKNNASFLVYNKDIDIAEDKYKNIFKWNKIVKNAYINDKIIPYFQPVFHKGIITHYECFMRLIDEEDNIVTSNHFLDYVVNSGIYTELTRVMFRKCSEIFIKSDSTFSFTLSKNDILNEEVVLFMINIINQHKLGKKIIFKIKHQEFVENYNFFIDFIRTVKPLACRICIDDFGTGYFNFTNYKNIGIDYIKINSALIYDMDKHKDSELAIKAIVNVATKISIPVIAKHIYSEQIYYRVKDMGIDLFQGDFLGKPRKEPWNLV